MELTERDRNKIFACPLLEGTDRLSACKLFEACGCTVRAFTAGDVIFSPEQGQSAIGWLLDGKAEISTPDQGKHTLLRFLSVGEPFGVASLFSSEPYVSVIVAKKSCRVFFLTEIATRRLLETSSAFLYQYLEFLSSRIRFLNRKIGYLTAGSTERRLCLYLTSQKDDLFTLSVSISDLSELLDVGRASLYRAFDKLEEDGLIKKDGRTIRLLNKEALLQAYQ